MTKGDCARNCSIFTLPESCLAVLFFCAAFLVSSINFDGECFKLCIGYFYSNNLGISGQSLRFYCEDCETGICSSCTDIEHREHATVRMSDAVDAEKEELRKLVERARTQVGWHGCRGFGMVSHAEKLEFSSLFC